jgi:hypothetical protein
MVPEQVPAAARCSDASQMEDDMMKSTGWTLALSACLASGVLIGTSQVQFAGAPAAAQVAGAAPMEGTAATTGDSAEHRVPGLIAPSGLYGAGPPIDGLDSHPYREARLVHKAPRAAGRATQSARSTTKASGSGTSN